VLGDVDGHIARKRPAAAHCLEQEPGFVRRSRAQLDQLAGLGPRHDLSAALGQDLALCARQVVLAQPADALEQLRAARVVEVLGRKVLVARRQPVAHVLGEGALIGAVEPAVDLDPSVEG
jgi:hypothetical protein